MSNSLKNVGRFFCLICLVTLMAVGLSACNSSKTLTKANVNEITDGMSRKQVESILGLPTTTSIETNEKKTTYVYAQGKESVTVIFKDDKVQSKASTLSE
jgi:outer membrane protein assembly factor BamE (lipoprotein component of BamABCDE complex)